MQWIIDNLQATAVMQEYVQDGLLHGVDQLKKYASASAQLAPKKVEPRVFAYQQK